MWLALRVLAQESSSLRSQISNLQARPVHSISRLAPRVLRIVGYTCLPPRPGHADATSPFPVPIPLAPTEVFHARRTTRLSAQPRTTRKRRGLCEELMGLCTAGWSVERGGKDSRRMDGSGRKSPRCVQVLWMEMLRVQTWLLGLCMCKIMPSLSILGRMIFFSPYLAFPSPSPLLPLSSRPAPSPEPRSSPRHNNYMHRHRLSLNPLPWRLCCEDCSLLSSMRGR